MVHTDIHLLSVSSKPRPDEPKEPKKWVEEFMSRGFVLQWFFWGTPKKIGGEKNTKKHDMKKTPFFLFTKNWNRDDVLFSICIAWKKSNLFFFCAGVWLIVPGFLFLVGWNGSASYEVCISFRPLTHDSPVAILNEPFRICPLCWGWS